MSDISPWHLLVLSILALASILTLAFRFHKPIAHLLDRISIIDLQSRLVSFRIETKRIARKPGRAITPDSQASPHVDE